MNINESFQFDCQCSPLDISLCVELSKLCFAALALIRWLKYISLRVRAEELTQIMSEVQELSCI